MKVKFRMDQGQVIRDASGRYACPNMYCWHEHFTGIKPGIEVCPQCGVELDWKWVLDELPSDNRCMDSSKE